jgi:hypothetical protein
MIYNLETGIIKKKLYIEGNTFITADISNNILSKYDILYFNEQFNNSIDNLPSTIKAIRFTKYNNICYYISSINVNNNDNLIFRFNKSIQNLPFNLELLELSGNFTQSLNYLPNGLKYLILNIYDYNYNYDYNYDYSNIYLDFLPNKLEILILTTSNYKVNNLPIGLKELYLIGHRIGIMTNLPANLKLLFINGNANPLDDHFILPPNLEIFIFNDCEYLQSNIDIIIKKMQKQEFPKTLQKILFSSQYCKYNTKLITLSSYIDNLIITYKYIDDTLIKHIIDKY